MIKARIRKDKGFTLIELMLVITIIGLIASILVPNYLVALEKAKQKRTLSDLRGIGTAWMSWLTDQSGAASAGASVNTFNATNLDEIAYSEIFAYLHPTETFFYAQAIPEYDAWGTPYVFRMGALGSDGAYDSILVCSAGNDGTFSNCTQDEMTMGAFPTTDFDRDIVWANGTFITWPGDQSGS